jgi:hypothetical protein
MEGVAGRAQNGFMLLELVAAALWCLPALFVVGVIITRFADGRRVARRLYEHGRVATATVLSSELADGNIDDPNKRLARVAYQIEPDRHIDAKLEFKASLFPGRPGDRLTVRYDPADPQVVRVDIPRYVGPRAIRNATIGLVISGAVGALLLLTVVLALIGHAATAG